MNAQFTNTDLSEIFCIAENEGERGKQAFEFDFKGFLIIGSYVYECEGYTEDETGEFVATYEDIQIVEAYAYDVEDNEIELKGLN